MSQGLDADRMRAINDWTLVLQDGKDVVRSERILASQKMPELLAYVQHQQSVRTESGTDQPPDDTAAENNTSSAVDAVCSASPGKHGAGFLGVQILHLIEVLLPIYMASEEMSQADW